MKRIVLSLCALLLTLGAEADNKAYKRQQEQAQQIMADDSYIYGTGFGNTYADADQRALQDLLSKISVSVSSSIDIKTEEINLNGQVDSKNVMQAVVNSYAHGALNNTQNLQLADEPEVQVMRYVKKSDVEKIFTERIERVRDYVRSGMNSEKNGRIDDALRYFYWGYNLLKSVQNPSSVTVRVDGQEVHPLQWIPQHINDIMSALSFQVSSIDELEIELMVKYADKPVTSLDFYYYDGMGWSALTAASNGTAQVDMRPGASMDNLRLRVEYEYRGQARQDPDLEQVMQVFKSTPFRKATYNIKTGTKKERKEVQKEFQAVVAAEAAAPHTNAVDVRQQETKTMTKTVERLVAAVKDKKYDSVRDCFTDQGWSMFQKLISYGKATLVGTPTFSFYPMLDKTVCRGIPMKFTFKNNHRNFIETVTFTFDSEQKIESLAFALDQAARDDIFNKGVSPSTGKSLWNDSVRMVMACFLENYKTAFALKRLDYIESIFDDNAVIITGSYVKKAPQQAGENEKVFNDKVVRFNVKTKNEYLRSLKRCFDSNEFINIRFADNDVSRMSRKYGETFGIQIRQDYYSSNYADTGYLFLMIDMNDPNKPIIKVRTWQPERDPSLSTPNMAEDPFYGVYSGANF